MKYLARQPILNRERELFAYELLFRNGIQNSCDGLDLELASTSVLDTSFLIGFEKITAGHRMFINCPRDFLLRDYISLFPPNSVVVEILENIKPDQEVIEACQRLKQAGYTIALDDFVDSPDWAPLVALADIIKVDFRLTDPKGTTRALFPGTRQKTFACWPKKWKPRRNSRRPCKWDTRCSRAIFSAAPK